jgi:hypothetical protein
VPSFGTSRYWSTSPTDANFLTRPGVSASDHKTTKIMVALTPHVKALRRELGESVRILNITGMRAEESPSRRYWSPTVWQVPTAPVR